MTGTDRDLPRVAEAIRTIFGRRMITQEEILLLLSAEIARTYTHAERGYTSDKPATAASNS